jgi:hypothetical protein
MAQAPDQKAAQLHGSPSTVLRGYAFGVNKLSFTLILHVLAAMLHTVRRQSLQAKA